MQMAIEASVRKLEQKLSDPENLTMLLVDFRQTVLNRLEKFWRSQTLVTYEGTMLDKLLLHFVEEAWMPHKYTTICSVRPCMLPELIKEVREFASGKGYFLVDFKGDCPARFPWQDDLPKSCENVGHEIHRHLQNSNGLLVSSALIDSTTRPEFNQTNADMGHIYTFKSDEIARHRHSIPDKNWNILFAFQGFSAEDLLLAHIHFVGLKLERYHLPICYLDCYNEQQQRKFIELMEYAERLYSTDIQIT